MLRKVMETAEKPKLVGGLEEKFGQMGTQRISVSDHMNGLQYTTDKSENFIVDMESFAGKEAPANSRISRSLSRKWSHRGGDEKVIPNGNANNEKNQKDPILPSPSPRVAAAQGGGATVPDKSGTMDRCSNSQVHHHRITITTTNLGTTGESRCARRNSFWRPSSSSLWIRDPKRILFVFATLSSIGTILLIYFTLSIGKPSAEGAGILDLQQ